MMTMTQGSWLIHLTLLDDQTQMIYLYYSWHLLAVFLINIILCSVLHVVTKSENLLKSVPKDNNKSAVTANNPTGLTVTIRDAGRDSVEQCSDDDESSSGSSVPTQLLSMVDSETSEKSVEGERVSPLEEFNTLHRHTEGVRKSIKLKESSIV